MLEPIMNILGSQRVILASSSPRRQEILKTMGLKFEVIPSLYEEDLNPDDFQTPSDFVVATAVNKVAEVEQRLKSRGENFDLLIGADTMVHMDNKIYGKPKDETEAFNVLKSFSAKSHTVVSGVCLKNKTKTISFSEITKVYFAELPDEVITAYIKSGEPFDKAGGYGIQGKGGSFVESINGDYYNVVGLPLFKLFKNILSLYTKK